MCIDIMGDPWVPMIRMGMDLGIKLNLSWVIGFLTGRFYFCGYEFGMAKSSGFVPVAIINMDDSGAFFRIQVSKNAKNTGSRSISWAR